MSRKIKKKIIKSSKEKTEKKTLFSKENIAITISILTFVITITQTVYFHNQTRYLQEQTNIQHQALDEFKKDAQAKFDLETQKISFDEKQSSSKLLVNPPKIIKNGKFTHSTDGKVPFVIDFSATNIGNNSISNYSLSYVYFIRFLKNNSLYPVNFSGLKRKKNNVIFVEQLRDSVGPNGEDVFYIHTDHVDTKKKFLIENDEISTTVPKDSTLHIYNSFGLNKGEKIFTENIDYDVHIVMKISYRDEITLKYFDKYGLFSFDKDWTSFPITTKKDVEIMKKNYDDISKN